MMPAREKGAINLLAVLGMALLLVSLPVVVKLVQERQEVRKEAVYPTSSPTPTPIVSCKGENQSCSGSGQGDCCSGLKCASLPGGKFCIVPGCQEGERKCSEVGNYVQECQNGQWVNVQRCDAGCSNATCSRICTPGATKCADSQTQETCSSDGGAWGKRSCPYGCSGGKCQAAPTPTPHPTVTPTPVPIPRPTPTPTPTAPTAPLVGAELIPPGTPLPPGAIGWTRLLGPPGQEQIVPIYYVPQGPLGPFQEIADVALMEMALPLTVFGLATAPEWAPAVVPVLKPVGLALAKIGTGGLAVSTGGYLGADIYEKVIHEPWAEYRGYTAEESAATIDAAETIKSESIRVGNISTGIGTLGTAFYYGGVIAQEYLAPKQIDRTIETVDEIVVREAVAPGGGMPYEAAGRTVCRVYCNTPEFRQATEAFQTGADQVKVRAFNQMVRDLSQRGIRVFWTEPGAVQRVTGSPRNYATVQGNTIYMESQLRNNPNQLLRELTHELGAYELIQVYGSKSAIPRIPEGGKALTHWLDEVVRGGGRASEAYRTLYYWEP